MTPKNPICKNCGFPIEPSNGMLYPWTHCDPNQNRCLKAEPIDPNIRPMTLPAIRKRFDAGSWNTADLQWLYRKAEEHSDLLQACELANAEFVGLAAYFATCAPDVIVDNLRTTVAALKAKQLKVDAAIRYAKGEL